MPFVQAHYRYTQRFGQGDIGMATMNMCYQTLELGLSTCMLGLNDQNIMEEYFGILAGNLMRIVLAVRYAAEEKAPRKKSASLLKKYAVLTSGETPLSRERGRKVWRVIPLIRN